MNSIEEGLETKALQDKNAARTPILRLVPIYNFNIASARRSRIEKPLARLTATITVLTYFWRFRKQKDNVKHNRKVYMEAQ